MPELPDVQVYKEYLDATSLHQSIQNVEVADVRILEDVTGDQFKRKLHGRSLNETYRHGKYLFIHTDDQETLMMHFGMTGKLKYYQRNGDDPEYTKVRFDFENGYNLAYICPRILGRLQLVENIESFLNENDIGPDALRLKRDEFKYILNNSRAMIKSTFMDQGKMAGIGNEYSDEILFQTGIHPRKQAADLDNEQLEALYDQMHNVCNIAIEKRIEWDEYPETYLTPRREEGKDCPICSGTIQTMKINSRSCYYCPQHQGD